MMLTDECCVTDGIFKIQLDMKIVPCLLTVMRQSLFSEAMKSANLLQWQQAMDYEMTSLVENKTWQLVEKPEGRKIVDNRWVYKVKLNMNGCVDKFKARLVA